MILHKDNTKEVRRTFDPWNIATYVSIADLMSNPEVKKQLAACIKLSKVTTSVAKEGNSL